MILPSERCENGPPAIERHCDRPVEAEIIVLADFGADDWIGFFALTVGVGCTEGNIPRVSSKIQVIRSLKRRGHTRIYGEADPYRVVEFKAFRNMYATAN